MPKKPIKIEVIQEGDERFLLKGYADGSEERTPIVKLPRKPPRYRYRTVTLDKSKEGILIEIVQCEIHGRQIRQRTADVAGVSSLGGAAASIGQARGADIVGRASVIDGDTIEIHGERIRLWGIDALESDQLCRDDDSKHYQCGRLAANALAALFTTIARPVTCSPTGRD